MDVLVASSLGIVRIDLEEGEWELTDDELPPATLDELGLPLVIATARSGARLVAVVDRRPPLVLSDDAGATWKEAGSGLPPGVAIAISPDHPDDLVYASSERLFVSRDGGRFWSGIPVELHGIERVAFAV